MDSLYHSVLEVLHIKEYLYSAYISCKCLNSFQHVLISTQIPDDDLYGLKCVANKLKTFKICMCVCVCVCVCMYMCVYIYIYM
jgi:hypothetical protein